MPQALSFLSSISGLDSIAQQHSLQDLKNIDYEQLLSGWLQKLMNFGIKVVIALIVFYLGRLLASLLVKWLDHILRKRHIDKAVITFVHSFASISLFIFLIVLTASILGVQSVSFAALLASAGVAIGMGLSGQLQNLAGGLIILLSKPFQVNDHIITAADFEGKVEAVGIFHTVIRTFENRMVYIPNGKLASNEVTNVSKETFLRNSWTIGIEYNQDFEKVKEIIGRLIASDERILEDPAPYVVLHELGDSSVKVLVRAYSKPENYWDVNWDFNRRVYAEFNRLGISFPFPQLTIHHAANKDQTKISTKENA